MGSSVSYNKIALVQWYWEGTATYGVKGYLEAAKTFTEIPKDAMRGKIVLVTGGNQGIGFAAARGCAELGASEVHLLCRNRARGEEAAKLINDHVARPGCARVHELDVGEFARVREFAAKFVTDAKSRSINVDVLINNAGCMPDKLTKTSEGKEAITACTFGGCVLLTSLLLPVMTRGSHVINVASGGAYTVAPRVDDLNFDKVDEKSYDGTLYYAYAKRHQILLTQLFAEKVGTKSGVRFNSMHPGWADTEAVRSSMSDFYAKHKDTLRSAEQGADTIVYLASGHQDADKTGQFWFDRKPVRTDMPGGGTAASADVRERLWHNALAYVGLAESDIA